MYGELQVKPWELYKMTFRQVVLSITGLRERDLMQQAIARRMTVIISSTNMGGSKIASKIKQLWPMPDDDKISDIPESAKATLRKFKEITAMTKAVDKINNRNARRS